MMAVSAAVPAGRRGVVVRSEMGRLSRPGVMMRPRVALLSNLKNITRSFRRRSVPCRCPCEHRRRWTARSWRSTAPPAVVTRALHHASPKASPLCYYAFDLLHPTAAPLRTRPLDEREPRCARSSQGRYVLLSDPLPGTPSRLRAASPLSWARRRRLRSAASVYSAWDAGATRGSRSFAGARNW
jgi:hypothetical protein